MNTTKIYRVLFAAIAGLIVLTASNGASASDGAAPRSVSYKVYTAILSQSGTNAPVATVLENTIGGTFTWGRDAVGQYSVDRSGGFVGANYVIEVHKRAGFAFAFMNAGTVLVGTYDLSNHLADGELNLGAWIEIREY